MTGYDYRQVARQNYRDRVKQTADMLRDVADRVEREDIPRVDTPDHYPDAAISVMHELTWGVANLNLETLFVRANEVVRAERDMNVE